MTVNNINTKHKKKVNGNWGQVKKRAKRLSSKKIRRVLGRATRRLWK